MEINLRPAELEGGATFKVYRKKIKNDFKAPEWHVKWKLLFYQLNIREGVLDVIKITIKNHFF